jgi:hypothetical protein
MAATTLVKDFIWRICQVMNDYDPQYVVWPETEIVQAINDGQSAILKFIPTACVRVDSIKLAQKCLQSIDSIPAASIVQADGGSPPSGGVKGRQLLSLDCNMTSSGTLEGAAIRISDRYDMDVSDPLWQTRTAATVREYTYNAADPKHFRVIPAPSGANQWVRCTYTAYPTKIADGGAPGSQIYSFTDSSTALLSIDDANVDDLFWYVTSRLHMKDDSKSKPQWVSLAQNSFASSINAQVQALRGLNPNIKHLPMVMGWAGGEPLAGGESVNADRT